MPDERLRLLEPVVHVGGAADDERVVSAEVLDRGDLAQVDLEAGRPQGVGYPRLRSPRWRRGGSRRRQGRACGPPSRSKERPTHAGPAIAHGQGPSVTTGLGLGAGERPRAQLRQRSPLQVVVEVVLGANPAADGEDVRLRPTRGEAPRSCAARATDSARRSAGRGPGTAGGRPGRGRRAAARRIRT